ncbi:type II toxin-antitoxin system YoeB family toxin [Candidatus Chloroploca asiatica]|uniref:type II toxin-antitoxin system YoeB family toxin n=1 Tax=Candidatus Chloroploca asiatica TaxID=1506545 RepID=UPI000BEA5CA4
MPHDRKKALQIIRLIQETQANPFGGIGKPEPLTYRSLIFLALNGITSLLDPRNKPIFAAHFPLDATRFREV